MYYVIIFMVFLCLVMLIVCLYKKNLHKQFFQIFRQKTFFDFFWLEKVSNDLILLDLAPNYEKASKISVIDIIKFWDNVQITYLRSDIKWNNEVFVKFLIIIFSQFCFNDIFGDSQPNLINKDGTLWDFKSPTWIWCF